MEDIKYFDIHSHLNFSQYDEDREEVIREMKKEDIWTVCVGTDAKTSQEVVDLANAHENIFACVGVHPTDNSDGFDEEYFEDLLKNKKVVAMGECGLDYFRDPSVDDKEKQKTLFIKQIDFALKHNLPLMLHMRPSQGTMDAYEDSLEILIEKGFGESEHKANAHFFAGSLDIAKAFLGIGVTLSFDGPITFSRDYDDVIKHTPLDMIMAETDSPFASPTPFRGKRNSPVYVQEVVKAISEIKNEDLDFTRDSMVRNAKGFFGL